MRLLQRLQDGGFKLTSLNDEHPPPYVILSHTWTEGQEVIHNEVEAGEGKNKTGYDKLWFCAEQAATDDYQYFWIDTCCIDKADPVELSTAINSMYRWYQRAAKCYVYLSDVSIPVEVVDAQAFQIAWEEVFRQSRWFTRVWTLQELLAPPCVQFFSREGRQLGSRISLEQEIHQYSITERMRWAATRTTTLKEDKVYCLLGIFGVFLPLIYGEGEEYATQRLEEEIARRQKGQGTRDQHNLSVSQLLPFPRNERFVGREDQLQSLKQTLFCSNTHSCMTVYGLGGCGKSALALEFAYRALTDRVTERVFWVPAISRDSFELAYREIANSLRIPGISDSNANINKLVRDTLSADSSGSWLMIVDNADDPVVLQGIINSDLRSARLSDFLSCSCQGAILFTTRSRKAAQTLTPNHVLELKDMSQAEARQLLVQCVIEEALLNDSLAIEQLLSILAYLPLAIVQAAAFINSNGTSVSKYVSLFEHAGAETELFSEQFEDPSRYEGMDSTIAKTQDLLAAEYLAFIACIDLQQIKALGTLTGYAFITERQQTVQGPERESFFDMHRLEHGERAGWVCTATNRLNDLVLYLPHAISIAGCEDAVDEAIRASLLERVGQCQESLGQYASAEASHRQEFLLRKRALGPEHPSTLTSISNLALSLALYERACTAYQTVLGTDHPTTCACCQHYNEAHLRSEQALSNISYIESGKPPSA
ncbi:HET-domain-containing protein [Setomelanomma holmii]|uniref:HET-domain-containing protein n=1 Tax=Setomelanomma holmii TaxID=210430 RepID=A0A9P4LT52_9PLEO|nr:HET-domain-containing protein [Setomelanomma holmii]